MRLRNILEKAIESVDTLEEYYKEQSNTNRMYVNNEMKKYKYGLAIYKFLCSRAHDEKQPNCMNEFEKKFIDEELILIENGDDKKVQYKLRAPENFEGDYELDPIIAEKRQRTLLNRQ